MSKIPCFLSLSVDWNTGEGYIILDLWLVPTDAQQDHNAETLWTEGLF